MLFRSLPLVPACVFLFAPGFLPRAAKRAASPPGTGSGTGALYHDPRLRRILITGAIIETGLELYGFYMPIHGHAMGLSASAIGVIMSTYAMAALLIRVAMPAMVRRVGEESVLVCSLLVAAAAYVVLPFVGQPLDRKSTRLNSSH